jgi:uncharacterized membrane protein YdjX (TVP38/TMEM64 family)
MTETSFQSLVYLALALILPLSALAGYKLSWKKGVIYALVWGSIFVGVALFIAAVRG